MLGSSNYAEVNNILSNYGYKTYSSLELDTSVEPIRVNTGLSKEDSIFMTDDACTISYGGKLPIPSDMLLVVEICQNIEHADTSGIQLLPGKKMNDKMFHHRRVKGR